jgi:2-phospho-L-lactate guanylyltransferase (CobY/MobA/RfbA family)
LRLDYGIQDFSPIIAVLPGAAAHNSRTLFDAVLSAHLAAPSFTISPAHDDLGSNAVVCSPPESVPLRFGENSYFPHLEAARRQRIEPTVIRQPGIEMDIDHPLDLALFLRLPQSAGTRTRTLLDELGVPALLFERSRTDDPDALDRLLLRHPLGETPVR